LQVHINESNVVFSAHAAGSITVSGSKKRDDLVHAFTRALGITELSFSDNITSRQGDLTDNATGCPGASIPGLQGLIVLSPSEIVSTLYGCQQTKRLTQSRLTAWTTIARLRKEGEVRTNICYIGLPDDPQRPIERNLIISEGERSNTKFVDVNISQVANMSLHIRWSAMISVKWIEMRSSRRATIGSISKLTC
jgi:hypothetical protein